MRASKIKSAKINSTTSPKVTRTPEEQQAYEQRIRESVAAAPPLTDDQRADIAAIFAAARRGERGAA